VVIDLYVGSITMSWSYGADDAAPALAEVERYLPVFERHGYVAYDPQLEHIYEPSRDQADAAEIHRDVREGLFEQTSGDRRRGGSVCSADPTASTRRESVRRGQRAGSSSARAG
jgi:hypothetical protein